MEVVVELAAVSERSPEVASSSHNPEEAVVEQNKEVASVADGTSEVMIPTTPFYPPRGYKFPATIQGNQKRDCNAHWFLDNKEGFLVPLRRAEECRLLLSMYETKQYGPFELSLKERRSVHFSWLFIMERCTSRLSNPPSIRMSQ